MIRLRAKQNESFQRVLIDCFLSLFCTLTTTYMCTIMEIRSCNAMDSSCDHLSPFCSTSRRWALNLFILSCHLCASFVLFSVLILALGQNKFALKTQEILVECSCLFRLFMIQRCLSNAPLYVSEGVISEHFRSISHNFSFTLCI